MQSYIDLNRRFVYRSQYDSDELLAAEITGKRLYWEKILENRISVIVAPANHGKTTEMIQQAKRMRVDNKPAFFVALRKVAERGNLNKVLDSDDLNVFHTWRASPTTQLTVFVDSLDEATAGKQDDFEYLIKEVAQELQWPNAHVKWVISTRPAVLTTEVMAKLTSILVTPILTASISVPAANLTVTDGAATTEPIAAGAAGKPEKIHLFSMAPLDQKQAVLYLTNKYNKIEPTDLLQIARERGLTGFTTSPGGLDIVANIDLTTRPPESLTEVFQRVVGAMQGLQSQDHRLENAGNPPQATLAEVAQKLASASQVCQLPNIEIPEEKIGVTEGVLSARLIAIALLTDKALHQLLNSQIFIDVGHHQVKLYPDELTYFLAAQRLSSLVQSPEHALKLVEYFSWRSPTGEEGVYRQYLPLMGWLATLNPHCREEILARDPQAVAFFGDLRNNNMPVAAAKEALRESIRRMAEQGDRLGRGFFTLTSENFWQAGGDVLIPLLQSLYKEYGDHYHARHALLDIVTNSRLPALRKYILNAHGGDYRKLILQSMDVRYLRELGFDEDLAGLANALKVEDKASESIVATLIPRLGWTYLTPKELADVVDRQFKLGRSGYHMSYVLGAGILDSANDQQLFALSRSMVVKVLRFAKRQDDYGISPGSKHERYVELVSEILAALICRPSFVKNQRVALLCLIIQRAISNNRIFGDVSELRKALQENPLIRRSFLSLIVRHAGQDARKLWHGIYSYGGICSLTAEDVTELNSDELTALFTEQEAIRGAQLEKPPRIHKASKDELKIEVDLKKQLLGMLEALRDGSARNGLAWVAGWLLHTSPNARYGEVNINVLEQEAGPEISDAIRAGFSKIWRLQLPTYKEDQTNSTTHITIAGLQALHLELQEGNSLPQLTEKEVRNALRYGAFEINGYPKWFWPLVRSHEKIAGQALLEMVKQANAGAVSLEHAEKLLSSLEDAPQSIQVKLAPIAWAFIQEQPNIKDYLLDNLLNAVVKVSGCVKKNEFVKVARKKINATYFVTTQEDLERAEKVNAEERQNIIWASSWLMADPQSFRKTMEKWQKTSPGNSRTFIFQLAAYLGNNRGGKLVRLANSSDQGLDMLGSLYEWVVEVVRPEEDNDHSDGEVYSPGGRDNAEQFRDGLIPAIAATQSQRAYEVLNHLRLMSTGLRALYLQNVQFEMREAQFTRPPLIQQKYNEFEHNFTADVTDTTSFAMRINSDLLTVKYDIEQGEYSLRRFFSELNFKRLNSDEQGLALEADFQRLLGSELNHLSRSQYSVTIEPHTAEAKRRDILCSKGNMFASIELKMSKRWTLEQYIEALEKQLVGQYMRHSKATIGFLVIVLQDAKRKWTNIETGKKVDFQGLLRILRDKALAIESRDRRLYIRVIGIDTTPPPNFRTVTKGLSKKGVKSVSCGTDVTPKRKHVRKAKMLKGATNG